MALPVVTQSNAVAPVLLAQCQSQYGTYAGIVAHVLAQRNIDNLDDMQNSAKFLLHYQGLQGMDAAVAVLSAAVMTQKRVVIIGDFDADGATSTALCMLAFRAMGLPHIQYLVPNRFDFGYGLSPQIVGSATLSA